MQKNKKQKKNSKAPTHKAVPATPLTKQERKAIEARMAKLKSSKKSSTQKTIPYLEMFQDGTCQITNSTYSKTIQFLTSIIDLLLLTKRILSSPSIVIS